MATIDQREIEHARTRKPVRVHDPLPPSPLPSPPTSPSSRTTPPSLPSAARPAPAARQGERLAALDGLRFLAALVVVFFHLVGQVPATFQRIWGRPYQEVFPVAHSYFAFGRLGVELFFVISGFVIAMSGWGRSPRDFFIARVARLYPMYWIAVLLTALFLTTVDTPFGQPALRTVVADMTMLQTPLGVSDLSAVYWTLWPELCFYLMFAVVVWRGVSYRRVVLFCGAWTVAAVLAPAADNPLMTTLVNPVSAPYFIAGLAFHLMYRFRPSPLLWGIVGMSWLLAVQFLLASSGGRIDWQEWSPNKGALVLAVTVIFALVGAVALGWTRRITWRWLGTAGRLTFPLYLIHYSVGIWLANTFGRRMDPWLLVVGSTLAFIALSYVLQRYAERPLATVVRRSLRSAAWRGPA
ncbi:acyltransferase [Streptomyces sp. NPDC051976]|uniref:acyltransferase family protein n=1 Tax=Streptomyces sp. NPDC051976 TaxID=3154947 RepID=UPI0034396A16